MFNLVLCIHVTYMYVVIISHILQVFWWSLDYYLFWGGRRVWPLTLLQLLCSMDYCSYVLESVCVCVCVCIVCIMFACLCFKLCGVKNLLLAFLLCRDILTVFLAAIRGLAAGFFMSVYLYTPEVAHVMQ